MSPSAFDDLARSLAQPTSRRRALRIMGAAALAATVPALRPARARATPPDCAGKCTKAQGTLCQFDLPTCTPYVCCPAPYTCCAGPASATCCEPGCTCGDDGRGFKACQNCPRCKGGFTECGTGCCPPGTTCAGKGSRYHCCAAGRAPCGPECCGPRERCANAAKGLCAKCAKGHEACGNKCCPDNELLLQRGRRAFAATRRTGPAATPPMASAVVTSRTSASGSQTKRALFRGMRSRSAARRAGSSGSAAPPSRAARPGPSRSAASSWSVPGFLQAEGSAAWRTRCAALARLSPAAAPSRASCRCAAMGSASSHESRLTGLG